MSCQVCDGRGGLVITPDGEIPYIEPCPECDGAGEHEGQDCWCDPAVIPLCPVCRPEPPEEQGIPNHEAGFSRFSEHASDDCWRCGGDGILDPNTSIASDAPCIVVHSDPVDADD